MGDAGVAAVPMARVVAAPQRPLLPMEAIQVRAAPPLLAEANLPAGTPMGQALQTPINAPSTHWRTEVCPGAPRRHFHISLTDGNSTPGSGSVAGTPSTMLTSPVATPMSARIARPLFRRGTSADEALRVGGPVSAPGVAQAAGSPFFAAAPRPVTLVRHQTAPEAMVTTPSGAAKPILFSRPAPAVVQAYPVAAKGKVTRTQLAVPAPLPTQAYEVPAGTIVNTPSPDAKRGAGRTLQDLGHEDTPEKNAGAARRDRRLATM